jgi:nucleoside-diphosphate-sugar epimerase
MNVFVTGGSGVLGRSAISQLVAAGHCVAALSHRDQTRRIVESLGACAVPGELFAPASYAEAIGAADAVLHLATRIPPPTRGGRLSAWKENDRIRLEGARHLLSATPPQATFIYPSVCFVYPDSGDAWIDATCTAAGEVPPLLRSTLEAEAQVAAFTQRGARGIVLRMGQFYGDDVLSRLALQLARRGFAVSPGLPEAYQSWIWIPDAAAAVAAALDLCVAPGIYDICDDEPLRRREVLEALAASVGRRRLWRIPNVLVRPPLGAAYAVLSRSLRVSNRRFKEASGWRPQVRSVRDGWQALATFTA